MARVSRKANTVKSTEKSAMRIWNTALYIRLSVEDNGRDSDSLENQMALLERYVADRPELKRAGLFSDNGYTGTNFDRPGFQRMMSQVQAGKIDCIVVKDLSRLGRNYIETSEFIEKIVPFFGIRFISVNDGFDTEKSADAAQLTVSLHNIVNDYYAKDISRKVTSALRAKMERGDYIGNYAPYGYQKDPENKNRLIICPVTSPVIRKIFEWRAAGVSYMGINRRLNDLAIPSPGQYRAICGIETNNNKKRSAVLWNKHMVTEILQNEVYIGHTVQRKGSQCLYGGIPFHVTGKDEQITVNNTHEPIISDELFFKVQNVNKESAERSKASIGKYSNLPKSVNIYGKKFVCGECGKIMKLHRSISKNGDKAYFMFKCPTYAEHGSRGCFDVKMKQSELDKAVLNFIKAQMAVFIDAEDSIRRLLSKKEVADGSEKEIKALKQKLDSKNSLLQELYVDLKDGFLSRDEYLHHRAVIQSDIETLQARFDELEVAKSELETQITGEAKWRQLIEKYFAAEEMSAEIADAFIDSIAIYKDGSLKIRPKYMDELKALMEQAETTAEVAV